MFSLHAPSGSPRGLPASSARLRHLPVALVLTIYLPAALFGAWAFANTQAWTFLLLLAVFVVAYYAMYPLAARVLRGEVLRAVCRTVGARVPWRALSWLAVVVYLIAIAMAAWTAAASPLAAALRGASITEIAHARGEFLANRTGAEALLRYVAVIFGRSVLPFLVAYLYWSGHRARHLALVVLLAAQIVSLEKAGPIFAFLPLVLLQAVNGRLRAAAGWAAMMLGCILLWSFLAFGGLHDPQRSGASVPETASTTAASASPSLPPEQSASADSPAWQTPDILAQSEQYGDPNRHYMPNLLPLWVNAARLQYASSTVKDLFWLLNRMIWIPYVTAYDWLGMHDKVMEGRFTHGRQIGILSRLMGEPRLPLEQIAYRYQFGASPGGTGASNTVFFVDVKLAFGWPGVIAWCLLFPVFAAAIFESSQPVAKVASVTSFFTAALSPLTATLLSGGLFFFIVVAMLTGHDSPRSAQPAGSESDRHA